MTTLFVAGEGFHEIGKWAEETSRRDLSTRTDGVLAELFRKVHSRPTAVVGGVQWKRARIYRAGEFRSADQRRLRGAALQAEESAAEVFVWSRDSDHIEARCQALTAESSQIQIDYLGRMHVVGGMTKPCIEAWIVTAAKLHPEPETLSVPKLEEITSTAGIDTEATMVALIQKTPIGSFDTASLLVWLNQAKQVP